MYRPDGIILKILSIQDVPKKEGYMLEIEFNNQQGLAKPSPGALALFFKDQEFTFPFTSKGVIDFKLVRMNMGAKEVAAAAEFNLAALIGNMDQEIIRSIGMKWTTPLTVTRVKPLLSFALVIMPAPPRDLNRSVWGDLKEGFPDLHSSHPDLPLFGDHQSAMGESLWMDMKKPSVFVEDRCREKPRSYSAQERPQPMPQPVAKEFSPVQPNVGIPPHGHYGRIQPTAYAYLQPEIYDKNQMYPQQVFVPPPAVQSQTRRIDEEAPIEKGKRLIHQAARSLFARSRTDTSMNQQNNDPKMAPYQTSASFQQRRHHT